MSVDCEPSWPLRNSLFATRTSQSSYVPGSADEIRLNRNEAPADVAPQIKAEVLARLAAVPWHRYDDPDGGALRRTLAAHHNLDPAAITVGHGVTDLLQRVVCSLEPTTTVHVVEPDYYFYTRAAAVLGVPVCRHPLVRSGGQFLLPIDQLLGSEGPGVLVLSQPNNPTGALYPAAQIDRLLRGFAGLVVVDEAYAEFAGVSLLQELTSHPKLLILRSLSKAQALAGVRIGWLAGDPALIAQLNKLQPPFPIGTLTSVAAEVVLGHGELARQLVDAVCAERQRLIAALSAAGVTTLPSHANFVLCELGARRRAVLEAVAAAHVAVRDIGQLVDLHGAIRITVGSPLANDRVISAITAAVAADAALPS